MMLEQLRVLAARIDPQFAELRARTASLGVPVPLSRLWERAKTTTDPAARLRVGVVMSAVASRLACSGAVLERMLAAALAGLSADLLGSRNRDEIRSAQNAVRAWGHAITDAQEQIGTWPLRCAGSGTWT